jgi:hypothetical protein
MCFVDFTYKKEMENQKSGIISALEVLDNIKQSLNLADKNVETSDDANGGNFEDLVLQTEPNESKSDAILSNLLAVESTTRKTNSNTNNEISKLRVGKTISNGMNFTERPGSDYLLRSNTELEKGKNKGTSKAKIPDRTIKVSTSTVPDKTVSTTKLGIKVI